MEIHYTSRLMPEFENKDLPEDGHAFQIVRIADYGTETAHNIIGDAIVDSSRRKYNYLTEKEARELAAELMRNLKLIF